MLERAFPFETHLPERGSLFSLIPAGVQMVGLRTLESGPGIEVHLQEVADQGHTYTLTFPSLSIESARVCDLTGKPLLDLAVNGQEIRGQIEPRRLQTVQVIFKGTQL
jgi:hypothetical protein